MLTKSLLVAFQQCPRRLWLQTHRSDLLERTGDLPPFYVTTGHEVGRIARDLHPNGTLVELGSDGLDGAIAVTHALIHAPRRRPLFEATFSYRGVLVRTDLLIPGRGGWRLEEVKSSVSLKPHYLADAAIQTWAAMGAGVPITSVGLRLIDKSFRLERPDDYGGLFRLAVLPPEALAPIIADLDGMAQAALETQVGEEPVIAPGPHCETPHPCPFAAYCAGSEADAEIYPVSLLPSAEGKRTARRLLAEGIDDVRDIPADFPLSERLERVRRATVTGRPFHDVDGFLTATAGWAWPRRYLDFEAVSFPAPRWPGVKPFEQTPFQWSCHTQHSDGSVDHTEFLDISGEDPMPGCAASLVAAMGDSGAIITYNAAFERGRIKLLADQTPELSEPLLALLPRVVDLWPVVKAHYYHPRMRGSWSIKAVLPARLPHLSYDRLEGVKDGEMAQQAYVEALGLRPGSPAWTRLREQMLAYCRLDTEAMLALTLSLSQPDQAN